MNLRKLRNCWWNAAKRISEGQNVDLDWMAKHPEHFMEAFIGIALRKLIASHTIRQHIDGVSLVPLLEGKKSLPRKAIFWHYPHYGNQGGSPGGAVRAGDYKLIEFYEDNRVELYNLKADIGEKNNLAEKMPGKTAELHKMLQAWRKDVDAQMPTPNPDYNPGL